MSGGRVPQPNIKYRLLQAREEAGMSQAQLSAETGISPTSISYAETGKRVPRRTTITLWAMATGVDRDWLEKGMKNAPSPEGNGAFDGCARRDSNPQPSVLLPNSAARAAWGLAA